MITHNQPTKEKQVSNFKDIMINLETLGTVAGCVILSIGAVAFDRETGELGMEFYEVINQVSCEEAGLHVDQKTVDWWAARTAEAPRPPRCR